MVAYSFGAAIVNYGDTETDVLPYRVRRSECMIANLLLVIGFHLGVAGCWRSPWQS